MKNSIICTVCAAENPYYVYICKKCNSYLRERVNNIDLWKVIGLLIDNPKKAFQLIIYSEHKNFITFIILIVAAKFLVNTRFLAMVSLGDFIPVSGLFVSYISVLALTAVYISIYSFVLTVLNNNRDVKNRFRDNFSILVYSLLPNIIGVVFLIVIELAVFGEYLFSVNPTPFVVKGFISYMFAGAEVLLILWSVFLTFVAIKVQTNSTLWGILYSVIFYGCLFGILYFSSKMIFTI